MTGTQTIPDPQDPFFKDYSTPKTPSNFYDRKVHQKFRISIEKNLQGSGPLARLYWRLRAFFTSTNEGDAERLHRLHTNMKAELEKVNGDSSVEGLSEAIAEKKKQKVAAKKTKIYDTYARILGASGVRLEAYMAFRAGRFKLSDSQPSSAPHENDDVKGDKRKEASTSQSASLLPKHAVDPTSEKDDRQLYVEKLLPSLSDYMVTILTPTDDDELQESIEYLNTIRLAIEQEYHRLVRIGASQQRLDGFLAYANSQFTEPFKPLAQGIEKKSLDEQLLYVTFLCSIPLPMEKEPLQDRFAYVMHILKTVADNAELSLENARIALATLSLLQRDSWGWARRVSSSQQIQQQTQQIQEKLSKCAHMPLYPPVPTDIKTPEKKKEFKEAFKAFFLTWYGIIPSRVELIGQWKPQSEPQQGESEVEEFISEAYEVRWGDDLQNTQYPLFQAANPTAAEKMEQVEAENGVTIASRIPIEHLELLYPPHAAPMGDVSQIS